MKSKFKEGDEVIITTADHSLNYITHGYVGKLHTVTMNDVQRRFSRSYRTTTDIGFVDHNGVEWICLSGEVNFPAVFVRKATKLDKMLK